MAISYYRDTKLRYIRRLRLVRGLVESHMNAQRGGHNLRRRGQGIRPLPWVAALLLVAQLSGCSGGGSPARRS
jgi:hypothetical protein